MYASQLRHPLGASFRGNPIERFEAVKLICGSGRCEAATAGEMRSLGNLPHPFLSRRPQRGDRRVFSPREQMGESSRLHLFVRVRRVIGLATQVRHIRRLDAVADTCSAILLFLISCDLSLPTDNGGWRRGVCVSRLAYFAVPPLGPLASGPFISRLLLWSVLGCVHPLTICLSHVHRSDSYLRSGSRAIENQPPSLP